MSLFEAAAEGDQAQVQKLLQKGQQDIKAKDDRGWTVGWRLREHLSIVTRTYTPTHSRPSTLPPAMDTRLWLISSWTAAQTRP